MWTIRIRSMRNCLAAGALILAACGDSTTAPGTNPEIINTADNFQYQVSDIQQFSGTQTYSWQNSGTTATVNQSVSIAAGSATLVLKDANGVQLPYLDSIVYHIVPDTASLVNGLLGGQLDMVQDGDGGAGDFELLEVERGRQDRTIPAKRE